MKIIVHQGGTIAASLVLLLGLGACGDRGATDQARRETGQREYGQAAREGGRQTTSPSNSAGTAVMGAGRETKEATERAGGAIAGKFDDAKIVTKVKTGLVADKDTSALAIDVDSHDGVVTLTGTVPSGAARMRAVQIARDVKDVRSVEDRLTVKG
jgi:hyperosmotically inducible periplasmic protein